MTTRYVVVDGSNIATEGRSVPSLAQLDEAVRAFMVEHPTDQVIVVVDASFNYRIDESERKEYDQAEAAGEIVSPPAGAVGRGDGFLLRIADRTDAVVLSNDSFQEFHAEYRWLFDEGRLIGGKPVPGVGWIFTPRSPVRGPRSREVMRAQQKAQKAALKRAAVAEGPLADAIATATAEAIAPDADGGDNDGDDGDGEGETTKGGKRARAGGGPSRPTPSTTRCRSSSSSPSTRWAARWKATWRPSRRTVRSCRPAARGVTSRWWRWVTPRRSAKTVLKRGEPRVFVVQALDPPRRGIELALPGFLRVAGTPTEETVEAEISAGRRGRGAAKAKAAAEPSEAAEAAEPVTAPVPAKRARKAAKKATVPTPAPEAAPEAEVEPTGEPAPAKARRSRKATAAAADEEAAEPAAAEPVKKASRRAKKSVAAEPEAPAPVKKASRRAKKVAAPEPVALEPPPEKKPTRKRAAAKKVAAPEAAEPPAAEPAAPAKRRRRTAT